MRTIVCRWFSGRFSMLRTCTAIALGLAAAALASCANSGSDQALSSASPADRMEAEKQLQTAPPPPAADVAYEARAVSPQMDSSVVVTGMQASRAAPFM